MTFISVVPDINTRVCSISTKKFNQDVDKYSNIAFTAVLQTQLKNKQIGVQLKALRICNFFLTKLSILARMLVFMLLITRMLMLAAFELLDNDGKVLYRELVIEQTNEPDY